MKKMLVAFSLLGLTQIALAADVPTLTTDTPTLIGNGKQNFTLTIPCLEFTIAGNTGSVSAILNSDDLGNFVVDANSIVAVDGSCASLTSTAGTTATGPSTTGSTPSGASTTGTTPSGVSTGGTTTSSSSGTSTTGTTTSGSTDTKITVSIFSMETDGTYTNLNRDIIYTVGANCETWSRTQPSADAHSSESHLHYNAHNNSTYVDGVFTWVEYGPEISQADIDATCAAGQNGVQKSVTSTDYLEDKNFFQKITAVN